MTDQPTPPLHEQVRALEADLVMCREQLAQETERAESYRLDVEAIRAEYVSQQLPTPDATNPAHLRWAAEILVGYCLDAAQQQADADEELIEKAARVEVLWPNGDAELVGPVRARALHAANLLRDGGEK